MFVNDRIVFVELHKTGGTHIGKWLKRLVGGEQIGKHNRVPPHLRDRFIIGSVRNPWDWYVSLWAYGCGGKGSVHRQATRRLDLGYAWRQLGPEMGKPRLSPVDVARQCNADLWKPVARWRSVYRDVNDAEGFRNWLRMMMDPKRRFDMGEGFGFSPISSWAGLMTYRYLKLFTSLREELFHGNRVSNAYEAQTILQRSAITRFIIRNERLEEDLLEALALSGVQLTLDQKQELLGARERKTNASARMPASEYYDQASIELVAQREALIIDAHRYKPPLLA